MSSLTVIRQTPEASTPVGFTPTTDEPLTDGEVLMAFVDSLTPEEKQRLIRHRVHLTAALVREFGRGIIPAADETVNEPSEPPIDDSEQKVSATTRMLIEQGRNEWKSILDAARPRICKQYGVTSEEDVKAIFYTENSINRCERCNGQICTVKPQNLLPAIDVVNGVLQISYSPCKFELRNRQERLETKLKHAKIPTGYIGKTFDDYRVDALNKEAVAYAKRAIKTGRGAFLHGEFGSGKTLLAAIIAQEFLNAGKTVAFLKVPTLLTDIRDTYNGKSKVSEAEVLKVAFTADLLVLDDFGMEKPTLFVGSTLCSIIDARYDQPNTTTIITSNLTLEEIAKQLDHAVDGENKNGSRILDRCMQICKPICLKGKSRRK